MPILRGSPDKRLQVYVPEGDRVTPIREVARRGLFAGMRGKQRVRKLVDFSHDPQDLARVTHVHKRRGVTAWLFGE